MKTIELFAGTKSFSKVARALGHSIFTTDYLEIDGQDLVADVKTLASSDFPYRPDVLWASPPCEGFSVASIGKNWGGGACGYIPKSESAHRSIELAQCAIRLIKELKPTYWFIENPRGLLRKMPFMEAFLEQEGGYDTLCGTARTEIHARSQQTYGQIAFCGCLVLYARTTVLPATMNVRHVAQRQVLRASKDIKTGHVYPRNYSEIFLNQSNENQRVQQNNQPEAEDE